MHQKSGDGLHHFKNRNRCDDSASKYFVGSIVDGINIFALFSRFFALKEDFEGFLICEQLFSF